MQPPMPPSMNWRVALVAALVLPGCWRAAESAKPPTLPEKRVSTWEEAGADAGWLTPGLSVQRRAGSSSASLGFREEKDTAEPGEVSGFWMRNWKPGMLANLPVPRHAFGLDFHGTGLTDADLTELARFEQLQALSLHNTSVTS